MQAYLYSLFYISVLLVSACSNGSQQQQKNNSEAKNTIESLLLTDSLLIEIPLLKDYNQKLKQCLQSNMPILLLDSIDEYQYKAQQLAISHPEFIKNLFSKESRQAYRNEIFSIYPARPQEIPDDRKAHILYKVEMYNFALNESTIALTDLSANEVINIQTIAQTQPDIPEHLKQIALSLAVSHPAVMDALGYKPSQRDALMASTKTALNNTKCERSMHLCVAPTFTKNDKALWVIVDLTDFKIVGIRWTNTGKENEAAPRISEKKLKFEKIMECYCKMINTLERNNWRMDYNITSSDGLRIANVMFNGKSVIQSAKIVDWHVSYSNSEGFGYSDAVGCPEFSQAAVVAVSEPIISDLYNEKKQLVGFVLEQTFSSEQWPMPCNYNYLQRFEFYNDGRFRVSGASLGRGCGNNGTYRPVFRIAFTNSNYNFFDHAKGNWNPWYTESWQLQDERDKYDKDGSLYKIVSASGQSYHIVPSTGQFNDGARGDNAYVYVTRFHESIDEGENDLVSIGPCCNTDYRQGPEKFIEPKPESIVDSKIVLWYVPQMKNDDRPGKEYCWAKSYLHNGVYKTSVYPCMCGPMFIPFTNSHN